MSIEYDDEIDLEASVTAFLAAADQLRRDIVFRCYLEREEVDDAAPIGHELERKIRQACADAENFLHVKLYGVGK
jgi:hypothetical protein